MNGGDNSGLKIFNVYETKEPITNYVAVFEIDIIRYFIYFYLTKVLINFFFQIYMQQINK